MSGRGNDFAAMPDRVDGLLLLCLGAFMAGLASSNLYWFFLNPKFQHLTLTAGALLCLTALPPMLWPRPGRWSPARLIRQAALAIFLCLAMMAQNDADRMAAGFAQLNTASPRTAAPSASDAAPGAPDSSATKPRPDADTATTNAETPTTTPPTPTGAAPGTGPTARQAAKAASGTGPSTNAPTAEPLPGADESPPGGMTRLGPQSAEATRVNLRPVVGGVPYVRLNLPELYIMLDKGRKDYPPHFALRAQVLRSPKLDARGCVLLHRIAVVCCLADSLDLRFVTSGPGVDGLRDGEWVEVFGRLERLKGAEAGLPKLAPRGEGPGLALVNPKFRITAERIDRLAGVDFPYVFEFREKEPFAW